MRHKCTLSLSDGDCGTDIEVYTPEEVRLAPTVLCGGNSSSSFGTNVRSSAS